MCVSDGIGVFRGYGMKFTCWLINILHGPRMTLNGLPDTKFHLILLSYIPDAEFPQWFLTEILRRV